MDLKEYLHSNGIKSTFFAEQIDESYPVVWAVMNGKRDIRLSLAAKIEMATKGKVKCMDIHKHNLAKKHDEGKKSDKKDHE